MVLVLIPQVMVDADAEITACESAPEITKSVAVVSVDFNVPLAVLNPSLASGETDEENERYVANQKDRVYVSTIERTVDSNAEQKIYAVDEANRTYTFTFASDSTFIEGFKLVYDLYKNGEKLENGAFTSFAEDDTVELTVTANPAYAQQTFDISNAVYIGYVFNEEKSEIYVPETEQPAMMQLQKQRRHRRFIPSWYSQRCMTKRRKRAFALPRIPQRVWRLTVIRMR